MRNPGTILITLCLLTLGTTSLRAQSATIVSAEPGQFAAAALVRPLPAVAPAAESRIQEAALVRARKSGRDLGQVLMIVGGAGIVTGLIVDEPIVTIAGAGVGGYGLYLYLR